MENLILCGSVILSLITAHQHCRSANELTLADFYGSAGGCKSVVPDTLILMIITQLAMAIFSTGCKFKLLQSLLPQNDSSKTAMLPSDSITSYGNIATLQL